MAKPIVSLFFLLVLSSCGDSLTTPEDIPITRLPANEPFSLTLVMESCSDPCTSYGEPSCEVGVDEEDRVIHVDASVDLGSQDGECISALCGPQVLAHCDVPALPAGTYTVRSGTFMHQISLQ